MTKAKKRTAKVGAVLRDGRFYKAYTTQATAREFVGIWAPGSKHKWSVVSAVVTWSEPAPKAKRSAR